MKKGSIDSFIHGEAICYSGFRDGQQPGGVSPSYAQVHEDLLILAKRWKYIRLYDCDRHAKTTLEVIRNEGLNLKVLLGAYIVAEEFNNNCPWEVNYTHDDLENNRKLNNERIESLIQYANEYEDIVFALSVGNEATVDWTDHMVSVDRVIQFVEKVKASTKQAVTFCENYLPWLYKLEPLAEEVDFISIHTYPVWEYKSIEEALEYTQKNYRDVAEKYPHKKVVITEAGWATNSNGRGIEPHNVNEELQKVYIDQLVQWTNEAQILTFLFEAFDENWKGSDEALEPEKHWGLYKVDRSPKKVMAST